MIRRNIVGLIAVCAALAVGIALGGGPLSNGHADTPSSAPAGPSTRALAAAGDELATEVGPSLTGGKLSGQRIALVVLPGAVPATVAALTKAIQQAGGSVTATETLRPLATAPTDRTLVDTLGSQLASQLSGTVDGAASTYVRLGQLAALSVATTSASAGVASSDQGTIEQSLTTAKLAKVTGSPGTSAPLVLAVLGRHVQPVILAGIVTGLGQKAHGLVVTGDTASGVEGDLKRLRGQSGLGSFATVDADETALGQLAVVLTLVREITGAGGSYGASGIDGAVPLG